MPSAQYVFEHQVFETAIDHGHLVVRVGIPSRVVHRHLVDQDLPLDLRRRAVAPQARDLDIACVLEIPPFDHVESIAVRPPRCLPPRDLGGLDHERLAVPPARREPDALVRKRIGRAPAVHVDAARLIGELREQRDALGLLQDLHGRAADAPHHGRHARFDAGAVRFVVLDVVLGDECRGDRLARGVEARFHGNEEGGAETIVLHHAPYAGEVGFGRGGCGGSKRARCQ
jgi:hypothetical protein